LVPTGEGTYTRLQDGKDYTFNQLRGLTGFEGKDVFFNNLLDVFFNNLFVYFVTTRDNVTSDAFKNKALKIVKQSPLLLAETLNKLESPAWNIVDKTYDLARGSAGLIFQQVGGTEARTYARGSAPTWGGFVSVDKNGKPTTFQWSRDGSFSTVKNLQSGKFKTQQYFKDNPIQRAGPLFGDVKNKTVYFISSKNRIMPLAEALVSPDTRNEVSNYLKDAILRGSYADRIRTLDRLQDNHPQSRRELQKALITSAGQGKWGKGAPFSWVDKRWYIPVYGAIKSYYNLGSSLIKGDYDLRRDMDIEAVDLTRDGATRRISPEKYGMSLRDINTALLSLRGENYRSDGFIDRRLQANYDALQPHLFNLLEQGKLPLAVVDDAVTTKDTVAYGGGVAALAASVTLDVLVTKGVVTGKVATLLAK